MACGGGELDAEGRSVSFALCRVSESPSQTARALGHAMLRISTIVLTAITGDSQRHNNE